MRMKRLFVFATIILLAFNFIGCRKDVSETHHDFVGEWIATSGLDGSYLYIMDDGYSEYISIIDNVGHKEEHIKRGKAIVKNDYLKIGRFKKFKITQYPHQDSFGQWSMILDKEVFIKDKF